LVRVEVVDGNPWIQDLNEHGDLLVYAGTGNAPGNFLYARSAPGNYVEVSLPQVDRFPFSIGPSEGSHFGFSVATLNSNLQLAFTAQVDRSKGAYFYDFGLAPDDVPLDLEDGMKGKPDSIAIDIDEGGTVYGESDAGEPARWSAGAGWQSFVSTIRVSRDEIDPSVLSGNTDGLEPATVHKDSDGGFFEVAVTSGDSARYYQELGSQLWHNSISQRSQVSDPSISSLDGFICGNTSNSSEPGGVYAGFILTPLSATTQP